MNVNNTLENSVSIIKGIGEETESQLASMGIFTVLDLLEHFPYRFDDYRLRDLQEVEHDEKVTVEGKVQSEPSLVFYNRKRSRLTIHLLVGKNLIKVFFFNQPYLKKKISISDTITVSGKWDRHRGTITAQELKIGPYQKNADFEPVYTVRGSLTVKSLRKFIRLAFQSYGNQINENLPEDLIKKYKLLPR
ncbi:ATP-dependent DNA helicase RecG, partial [Heyndrickxia sporothermodurans]